MDGAIDGRSGFFEDARDDEGLVVMFGKGDVAEAVGDDDRVAELVAQGFGDIRAEHGVEQVVEGFAACEGELSVPAIAVVLEVVLAGAHDAKAAVAVAEGDRHDPVHRVGGGDVLVALIGHVVGGVADPKDGVEQELQIAAARADDQIRA